MFQGIEHTYDNILSGIRECVREHVFCLIHVQELVSKGMPVELESLGMVFEIEYEGDGFQPPADYKPLFVPSFVIIDQKGQVSCSISFIFRHIKFDIDFIPAPKNSPKCAVVWFGYGQYSITHFRFPSRQVFLFGVRKYPVWGDNRSIPFIVNGLGR
jgi:hypothetical protein